MSHQPSTFLSVARTRASSLLGIGLVILSVILRLLFCTTCEADDVVNWQQIDSQRFTSQKKPAAYQPLYVIQPGDTMNKKWDAPIDWHFFKDEEPVTYYPHEEILLGSSRVADRWLRMTEQAPHTVKWVLRIVSPDGLSVKIEPCGVVIGIDREHTGFRLDARREHELTMVRTGRTLAVQVDGLKPKTVAVPLADRTPLKIAAQLRPAIVRSTKLFFAAGESLSPPVIKPAKVEKPEWYVVYSEDFSNEVSTNAFVVHPHGSLFTWNRSLEAMEMSANEKTGIQNVFLFIKTSLPGDFRIRFRARNMTPNRTPFFGLMPCLSGRYNNGGYFIEWNSWQVQIKKDGVRRHGKREWYERMPKSGWMTFMAERVGGTITMYTEDKKVLTWTDAYPYADLGNDMFAFYVWRTHMAFDDIVIEANRKDVFTPDEDYSKKSILMRLGRKVDAENPE